MKEMRAPPAARPFWFRPAPYRDLRWTKAETEPALAAIMTLWSLADTRPVMDSLYGLFQRARSIRAERVASMDWSDFDSWALVMTVDAGVAVDQAIDEFLPPIWAEVLDRPVRHTIFMAALLVRAVGALLDDPDEPFRDSRLIWPSDPPQVRVCLPALRAEFALLARPHAKTELLRRGADRDGFPAAVILDMMRHSDDALRGRLFTMADVDDAVARLRDTASKRLPRAAWGGFPEKTRQDREQILAGQIPLTLTRDPLFRDIANPLEGLARALEGELDIAPRAIAYDLFDIARRAQHKTKDLVIEFRDEIPDQAAEQDDEIPDQAAEQVIEDFLAEYPEYRQGLEDFLSGAPDKELAAARGVTVQAISQRKKRAIRAFERWYRARQAAR